MVSVASLGDNRRIFLRGYVMAISAVLRILISFVVLALLAGWSNHAAEQRQRAELVAAQKQANEATGKVAAWEGPSEPMSDMLGGPEKQYDALAATDLELPARESTDRYLTAVAVAESLDPRVAASAATTLLTPTLL